MPVNPGVLARWLRKDDGAGARKAGIEVRAENPNGRPHGPGGGKRGGGHGERGG